MVILFQGRTKEHQNGIALHGKGFYRRLDGTTYDGNWKDGKHHGKGVLVALDGTTYWEIGKMVNTMEIVKLQNLDIFEESSCPRKHGYGTEIKSNGEKYMGMWSDDKYNGKGFYQHLTGVSYTGSFKNGSHVEREPCFVVKM